MFRNIRAIWVHGSANKCRKNQDYSGCVQYAQKAINLHPSDFLLASAYSLRGEGEYYLGKYQRASESFEKALDVTLNNPDIWTGNNSKRFISETNSFMQLCNKKLNMESRTET